MQIRTRNELIPLNLLVVVLVIAVILFPSNVIRIVLGLPFLLFFPGYVLIAALFPRRGRMDAIERIALSFGISIAIVPLIGLILNYSPWGIRLEPALFSLSSFVFATSIIAWLRCRRLPEQEQFTITFRLKLPGWGRNVQEMVNYPQEVSVGTAGNVVLRIANHEYQDVTYRIEIRSQGTIIKEVGPLILQHEQKWEQEMNFIPVSAGANQKVEFLLFKDGEDEPHYSLYLWLDIKERE